MLHRVAIISEDFHSRYIHDRRRKPVCVVAEYRDENGDTFRKSFYGYDFAKIIVPESGTHQSLNAIKEQFS